MATKFDVSKYPILEEYSARAVPIRLIHLDDVFNCRGVFTLQSIRELAASIRKDGLQCPVWVYACDGLPKGKKFKLIAGHRRTKACGQILKLDIIAARILDCTNAEAGRLNFIENLDRCDLNILEEAKAIVLRYGVAATIKDIAIDLRQTEYWVSARKKLLEMPDDVQAKAAAGLLPQGQILRISKLPFDRQSESAEQYIKTKRDKYLHPERRVLPPELQACNRWPRTRVTIQKKTEYVLSQGIYGGMPRLLAWCAGTINDEELEKDIQERKREQEILEALSAQDSGRGAS